MIIDKLKDWTYYKYKIPIYLRNCYGIQDHFQILFYQLTTLDNVEDNIFDALDVLNSDYENTIIRAYDSSESYDKFEFLDILGKLYGVNRDFNVSYTNDKEIITKKLHLNNHELLNLIRCRIIQNNFDGSYEQTRNFYDMINMPIYIFQGDAPATAYVILSTTYPDGTIATFTDNEKALFLSNLLTIKSMGISYITNIQDVSSLAIWDSTNTNRRYDKAKYQ